MKNMRLTVGQLKCASDFMKQITSARRELSHEIGCVALHHQTSKCIITHMTSTVFDGS